MVEAGCDHDQQPHIVVTVTTHTPPGVGKVLVVVGVPEEEISTMSLAVTHLWSILTCGEAENTVSISGKY